MEHNATVSVIIPNFNHARFLEQRIESVLQQTYGDLEIFILDDHSTDESRTVIERFRKNEKVRAIFYNETNSGSAFSQWRKGINAGKGKYIWIAESDDFCDSNFLEVAVQKLEEGYDLFNALTLETDESGKLLDKKKMWQDDLSATRWHSDFSSNGPEEVKQMLFRKNTIANASGVVFRRTGKLQGYLDQVKEMRFCGDWMFWMMYLLDAGKLYYSVQTRNYFRNHPAVTRHSRAVDVRNKEVLRVLRFILDHSLSNGRHKELVHYFFREHLAHAPKRAVRTNLKTFREERAVSRHFTGCWLRYYFS